MDVRQMSISKPICLLIPRFFHSFPLGPLLSFLPLSSLLIFNLLLVRFCQFPFFSHFCLSPRHAEGLSNDTVGLAWNRDAAECFAFRRRPMHPAVIVLLLISVSVTCSSDIVEHQTFLFYFAAWASAEVRAQSVPVTHLIVARVNELVLIVQINFSPLQPRIQSVLLPPFLALSTFLTSPILSSLCPCFLTKNAIRGMHLRGMKTRVSLFTVFQEEAKKAREEVRSWWAEEVCDRVSNEGNRGSD